MAKLDYTCHPAAKPPEPTILELDVISAGYCPSSSAMEMNDSLSRSQKVRENWIYKSSSGQPYDCSPYRFSPRNHDLASLQIRTEASIVTFSQLIFCLTLSFPIKSALLVNMRSVSVISVIVFLTSFLVSAYPTAAITHTLVARFSIGGFDFGQAFDDAKKKAEEEKEKAEEALKGLLSGVGDKL
jgi:hypothetical protein